jgi:hypothetical protein
MPTKGFKPCGSAADGVLFICSDAISNIFLNAGVYHGREKKEQKT